MRIVDFNGERFDAAICETRNGHKFALVGNVAFLEFYELTPAREATLDRAAERAMTSAMSLTELTAAYMERRNSLNNAPAND